MELLELLIGLAMMGLLFGSFAVALTSPSWLAGRLTRTPDMLPAASPLSGLVSTSRRRWMGWGIASIVALVGAYSVLGSFWSTSPALIPSGVGVTMMVVGGAAAQWWAFHMGRSIAWTRSRRAFQVGLPDSAAELVPLTDVPVHDTNDWTTPSGPLPASGSASEEYPAAQPFDDDFGPDRPYN